MGLDVYHQAAAGLQRADQGVAGATVLLRQGGRGQAPVLVERCGVMAMAKTCAHPDREHVLSGTQVRAMLATAVRRLTAGNRRSWWPTNRRRATTLASSCGCGP